MAELFDGSPDENVATLTNTGMIAFEDVDLIDTHTVSVTPQGGGYVGALSVTSLDDSTNDVANAGQVNWSFSVNDSLLDHLNVGDTLTQSYDVTIDDGHGGTATQVVTIVITGTNDAPVISAGGDTGSVMEPGDIPGIDEAGLGGGLASLLTVATDLSGLLTTPGDLDAVLADLVTELGDTAQAIGVLWDFLDDNYSYYNAEVNEAFVRLGVKYVEYLQGGGSPLVDVTAKYTADGADVGTKPDRFQSMHDNLLGNLSSVAMGDRFAGSLLTDLTILVSAADPDLLTRIYYDGQENHPAQGAAARQFDIDNGFVPTATGTLAATDVDDGASHSWSGNATGTYGTFAIDPLTGAWKYTLTNAAAADHIAEGATETDSFVVTATDESGATDTVTVTLTINGTNDAPVITGSSVGAASIGLETLPGIDEAGPGGPFEPSPGTVTPTIQAQLDLIPTTPGDLATILANIETEVGDTATAIADRLGLPR